MPSVHRACHLGFFKHNNAAVAALWAFLSCLLFAASAQAQVTLLVPSQPSVEAPAPRQKADAPAKKEEKKDDKRPQDAKNPADIAAKQPEQAGAEGKSGTNGEAAQAEASARADQPQTAAQSAAQAGVLIAWTSNQGRSGSKASRRTQKRCFEFRKPTSQKSMSSLFWYVVISPSPKIIQE